MTEPLHNILARLLAEQQQPIRRKCFVSYYSADTKAVDKFLTDFGDVFIPKVIGVGDGADFINSSDSEYVMSRIRSEFLGDSTVTICLIGTCTHSRRYIDWELKTGLRQGNYTPNGLLGILLPHMGSSGHLPQRFRDNWNNDSSKSYALYKSYPSSKEELRGWIEQAFARRSSHVRLIQNSQDMFKYNRSCQIHNVTH